MVELGWHVGCFFDPMAAVQWLRTAGFRLWRRGLQHDRPRPSPPAAANLHQRAKEIEALGRRAADYARSGPRQDIGAGYAGDAGDGNWRGGGDDERGPYWTTAGRWCTSKPQLLLGAMMFDSQHHCGHCRQWFQRRTFPEPAHGIAFGGIVAEHTTPAEHPVLLKHYEGFDLAPPGGLGYLARLSGNV